MLKQLNEADKAYNRQYEGIDKELIKLSALKLLKEIYCYGNTKEIIRKKEYYSNKIIYELFMYKQSID
jgi:hypothetical protein